MNQPLRVLMPTVKYPSQDEPNTVPFIARQVEFLRRAGVEVDVFHFKGDKKFSNYASAWRKFQDYKKDKKYDLIHAQWGQSATLALPKNLPLVITFRGNDLEGIVGANGGKTFRGRIQKIVSKITARFADEVIVVSNSLGKHLSRDDFHIIPSGLDLEIFRPTPMAEARRFLNLPPDKKLILFAASTVENPRKRYDLAKAAVEKIKKDFDAELILASNVAHSVIPYFINACDALLLTSVHEGSPNVVKESLACNLPIVSVDVGDVRARIENVEGCFLCENATTEVIANNLKKVLERGRKIDGRKAVQDLSEENIARRVIEVYKKAIGKTAAEREFFNLTGEEKSASQFL